MPEPRANLVIDAVLPDAIRIALSDVFEFDGDPGAPDAYRLSGADDAAASAVLPALSAAGGVRKPAVHRRMAAIALAIALPAAVAASWNLCGPEAFVVVGLRPDLITSARERDSLPA